MLINDFNDSPRPPKLSDCETLLNMEHMPMSVPGKCLEESDLTLQTQI